MIKPNFIKRTKKRSWLSRYAGKRPREFEQIKLIYDQIYVSEYPMMMIHVYGLYYRLKENICCCKAKIKKVVNIIKS